MSITEIIPSVQDLSRTDKLLLLNMLVQELLEAEGVASSNVFLSYSSVDVRATPAANSTLLTLDDRQAFVKQPLSERRRLLALQAESMKSHYENNSDWQELMAGDIVEY